MADHQEIGLHGIDGHGGVEQRLALGHGGIGHRHVHDVGAQALAGNFEGALGPGGGLEEEVHLGAPLKHRLPLVDLAAHLDVALGQVENTDGFKGGDIVDGQQVLAFEKRGTGFSGH